MRMRDVRGARREVWSRYGKGGRVRTRERRGGSQGGQRETSRRTSSSQVRIVVTFAYSVVETPVVRLASCKSE